MSCRYFIGFGKGEYNETVILLCSIAKWLCEIRISSFSIILDNPILIGFAFHLLGDHFQNCSSIWTPETHLLSGVGNSGVKSVSICITW